MAKIFDMQMYQITRDIDMAFMESASNTKLPKPRTAELCSFAVHAKRIVYFEAHGKAWGRTTATAVAEAVKDNKLAIHQLSPYRIRVVAFDDKCWFIDMYFSRSVIESETWARKLKAFLEETLKNGGALCRNLHDRFYPDMFISSTLPTINWKELEDRPFRND